MAVTIAARLREGKQYMALHTEMETRSTHRANALKSKLGHRPDLTDLDAGNVASGILSENRLSANVALLNRAGQTFTGTNTFRRLGIGTAYPAADLEISNASPRLRLT